MGGTPTKTGRVRSGAGLELHWESYGSGPALVCCNGVGVSTFFWKYIVEAFSDQCQVVLWDYRGHGRSDRPDNPKSCDLSIGACSEDLQAIMQAADVKKAVVLGHSMGCQVALETAVQAPEKVAGMVLMQGSAGKVLDTFFDSPNSVVIHRWLERGVDLFGHRLQGLTRRLLALPVAWTFTSKLGLVDPYYTKREDFVPYLDHMGKLDPRLFLHMVSKAHEHNLYPVLDEIHQPALVVAAEKDTFTPMWLSKRMVREMPNARLLVLAEATHAAIIEQPHTINASVRGFLRDLAWV